MVKLLRRNVAFVYFSFLVTGLTSTAPQRLFATAAAESAQAWVAGTLLVGTFASIAGVALAERFGLTRWPALLSSALILVMTAGLIGSFGAESFLVAAALQVLVRFMANYAKQEFDHRAVTIAGHAERVANDRVAVMMRFIGMLLGPLWFGAFNPGSPVMLVSISVLMTMSLVSAGGLRDMPAREDAGRAESKSLNPIERLFSAVAIGVYATFYLLASNIVYMLDAYVGSANSSAMAGILITIVYGAAMLTSIIALRWKRQDMRLMWIVPAPVLMVVAAITFSARLASLPLLISGAAALGLGFAWYLLAVRNQVTMPGRGQDKRWLAFFNNLANTSALVAFSLMAVLVAASHVLGWSYAVLFPIGLAGLSLLTIAGAAVCGRTRWS